MSTRKDYKVYGDLTLKYSVTVNAESPEIAYDAARSMTTDQWSLVPTDEVIDPYLVEEYN